MTIWQSIRGILHRPLCAKCGEGRASRQQPRCDECQQLWEEWQTEKHAREWREWKRLANGDDDGAAFLEGRGKDNHETVATDE